LNAKRKHQLPPAILVIDALLLVFLIYTPALNAQAPGAFIPTGNMTTPRVSHTATLLLNGKVLITGGNDPTRSGASLASAELFDPDTGMFTATGDMTTPRTSHTATLLPDGRVLIVGFNSPSFGTAELYDPSTGIFSPTGTMVGGWGSATLLNTGKVLITGGPAGNEIYDPLTGTFAATGEFAPEPPNPYGDSVGLTWVPNIPLPNGKVLIAGEPSAQLYDPFTGTFSLAGTMATRPFGEIPWYIEGRSGTLLPNGKVLLAGGEHEDLGYFAQAELYDPTSGTFGAIGNMTRNRDDQTATLLRDGTVLLAGAQYGGPVASSELYLAATQTFIPTADMNTPRFFHTATLLMDGIVLIAGGYTAWGAVSLNSNSAELYVPLKPIPAQVVTAFQFDRTSAVAGGSYSANASGSNLSPQTFFDVRFTAPGSNTSNVALNWQTGLAASHAVPLDTAPGNWTINGVRAHQNEADHTGNFNPVSATITVVQFP
jgi:hypothetical protein